MLTEGAKHVLGWKSPNFLYCNAINPRLKILLRNFVLSDDIAFRFSNKSWSAWPLTADKYASWLAKLAPKSELVNIFLDYETFGEHNWKETGIFNFLQYMPGAILKKTPFRFMTPSEVADTLQPVSAISVPSPISWADEERDITAWVGNELQVAALDKLYELIDSVNKCDDEKIKKDWEYLQSSDHFYYMATKFFSDGEVHAYFNPYETPYDAFMNYMNVLSDFEIRLKKLLPDSNQQTKFAELDSLLREKDELIREQAAEIEMLKKKSGKTKTRRRPSETKESGTSLKELAQKLMAETTTARPAAKTRKTVATRKTKSTSGKPAAKKTAAKKTVRPKRKTKE
jgi:alpha-amylase